MSPVYKLSANSVKNGRTVYGSMLAGNPNHIDILPGSFESIATTTLSTTATSITFSGIPQTYQHLQVRWFARYSGGDSYIAYYYNSDTTDSNYSWEYFGGNGGSVYNGGPTFNGQAVYVPNNASLASCAGMLVMDILDYTTTNKLKISRTMWGYDLNGAGGINIGSGMWKTASSAITSIKFDARAFGSTSDFATNSTIQLYGIKA